jgi:hypothetical protein
MTSTSSDLAAEHDPAAIPDPTFAVVLRQVKNDAPIPIRIIVRGVVLSGHLVSAHDYFQDVGNGGPRTIREDVAAVHSARFHPRTQEAQPGAEADAQADAAAYFHLREEAADGAAVRYWRVRIAAVDAWSLLLSSKGR